MLHADSTARSVLAIFLGLCSAVIWGAHSSVSLLGIHAGWDSFDLNATRVAGGLLISLPWLVWRYWRGSTVPWRRLVLLSCFAGVPFSLVNITGLQFAPITHGGAISLGMAPVIAGLLSRPVLGHAVQRDHWLALCLIVLGVAAIWLGTTISWSYVLGDLCFLLAATLWALYALYLRHWQIPPLEAAMYTSLGSAPYLLWYVLAADWPDTTAGMVGLQLLYQGLVVGVLAIFFYGITVSILGAQLGTLFSAMPPVLVPLAASLLLGYQATAYEYLGIVFVVSGMLLAFFRPLSRGRASRNNRLKPTG